MIFSFQNSAFRDANTGLYNRDYLREICQREWHRLARLERSMALILLDCECASQTHQVTLEQTIAELLANHDFRATDIVSKVFNNTFAIALFDMPHEHTTRILDKLRAHLNEDNKKHEWQHRTRFSVLHITPSTCEYDIDWSLNKLLALLEQARSQDKDLVMAELH